MLTRAQFERLPPLLAEIVKVERAIGEMVRMPVVPIRPPGLAELRERRAELRTHAAQRWGQRLAGDGATRA
jgi:hypothetical protein